MTTYDVPNSLAYNKVLVLAARYGDFELANMLLARGTNTHLVLHKLIRDGMPGEDQLRMIDVLLEAGADPNALDESHRTPLHHAVTKNNLAVVERLNVKGLNPNISTSLVGVSPLMEASPLLEAIRSSSFKMIKSVLKLPNVDVNAVGRNGQTALLIATLRLSHAAEVVHLLSTYGANVLACDTKNLTVLQKVLKNTVSRMKHKVVRALVLEGASINFAAPGTPSAMTIASCEKTATYLRKPLVHDVLRSAAAARRWRELRIHHFYVPLVTTRLYLQILERRFAPGGAGYMETEEHFERVAKRARFE